MHVLVNMLKYILYIVFMDLDSEWSPNHVRRNDNLKFSIWVIQVITDV